MVNTLKSIISHSAAAILALFMVVYLSLCSCTDYQSQLEEIGRQIEELEKEVDSFSLAVTGGPFVFGAGGGSDVVTVSSNVEVAFTVDGGDGWLEVEPLAGGTNQYAIKVSANDSPQQRTATIVFSGEHVQPQVVTVYQEGCAQYMIVSLEYMYFSSEGGAGGFSVSCNVPYTVSCNASWLTVSGSPDTGLAFYAVSATLNNAYVARTATVTFLAEGMELREIKIIQAASTPPGQFEEVFLSGDIPIPLRAALNESPGSKIKSVAQDETRLLFALTDGNMVDFTKSGSMTLSLDDDRAIIRGGGKVDVPYRVDGLNSSEVCLTVLFYADGWKADVIPAGGATGVIRLTAPDPAVRCGMLVLASDSNGLMTLSELHLKIEALSSSGPVPVSHIMPCCRVNNTGTTFLIDGKWKPSHQYSNIDDVRCILQNIQDAGINTVCIDFTNPSQWDAYGEAAQHGSSGEFWSQFKPMLENIIAVCEEKDMEYILFIGELRYWGIDYWNKIAGRILENWISHKSYRRYGYGDDRPLLVVFTPGSDCATLLRNTSSSRKNNLTQFRIGSCQINGPITPTATDGWGYRNYSQSNDGKVRFACPNGGVPPQDWYRVDDTEWRRRVKWAMDATEYAVLGSYDDTCDAIFWGIADVGFSITDYHINDLTVDDPFVYYDIVRQELTGME